jgi:diguanylate cyclase (GGDEF)-like protein/PAS domain S-box-containing protein
VTGARIAITLLPLLAPGITEIWALSEGRDANPIPLFVATLLLVALAFARSTRLVKARNRQEDALRRKTWFYSALAENSSDAVIVVGKDGRILNDAPNLAVMLGLPGHSTVGMDAMNLVQPVDREAARAALDRWRLTSGVVTEAEVRAAASDGSERWFGLRAANLSGDPIVGGIVLNLRDITDRKRAERALSHNSLHDSLTGLANRDLFHDRLDHALERTSRSGLEVAVVYLDLDGFKTINDSRGHEAGDEVLRELAGRLVSAVRAIDTVSRHGGDEFAIMLDESPNPVYEAKRVADRVLQSLTKPFMVGEQQVVLSASIGIAVGDVTCNASDMMRNADLAMYKAKTTGKARWVVYEPVMRTAALEQLELEGELRKALDKREFRLLYQPIVELESNAVVGFEALLRWDHPRLGVVEPDSFIPLAESNGTIVAIGRWVLDEACHTAARWRRSYPESQLTMAVNLSVCQIATPEIVAHVAAALEHSGFPAASLILEMTESVLVKDTDTATRRLEELRALGVRLAIDDFGTGYSSLSYLRQFPIDILKIDRSFTNAITTDSQRPAIVRGLLDLAKTLHIETIAEGIELDVQRESLRDQKCDFGQGFLFARPLDAVAAARLIAERQLVGAYLNP